MAVGLGGGGGGGEVLQNLRSWPRLNMIFQQLKAGTSVIPFFRLILIGKSISYIIFYDSRSSSMSKGQSKGQIIKNMIFTK